MKIVSNDIKNALKQPTTQRKGKILVNGNYYEVFNVEYYADAYNEGNVIGNTIASQLDFDLPYMDKFQTFKYFDGVWTGSSYEYIDMGTFHVFDEQDEDDFNKHITSFDNLIKFNVPFNDVGGYPKTLFQELQNVCNQAGVNLQNMSITNGDFQVINNQFVNGESLKTVLKAICQISGAYATIKNDELVLQLRNKTNEIINKNQHEPVIWKRKTYGINQVVLGMSDVEGEYVLREDTQDIAQNGVHKLVINDNPFAYTQAKRDELIDGLFNQVRGFGYIPYEMNCEWLNYLDIGDTITIDDVETIVLRINGKSPKSLESSMSAPAVIDSSITYIDNTETVKNQLKRTEIIVDKNNQSIQSVIEQTEEQNQKIAQVTQTVEELNSKISDIADITTSGEDTDAKIELNEINQSEPIRLVVRPIGENISYLYPSDNLYPSDDLFMKIRTIRFHNNKTNENFDYELPDDLLYYDSENYDEFILDYDGQSCVINKKVGYNADGTTYVLDKMKTVSYSFPKIILSEGDYTISILSYDTGYIFARLMAKNIYTTQFYTKAEVDSEISQTAQDIELKVNGKFENYSTTTEMNSAIQLSASNITSNVSQNYATKTAVENIENTLDTKIEQTADSITNTVSQTYSTKAETATAKQEAINSANTSTDTKLKNYSTTTQMKSEIKQSASIITSNVSETYATKNELTTAQSSIKQTTDAISTEVKKKVNNEEVVSIINQSAEQIILKSNRLVIDSTNFKLTKDGTITANAGTFGGTINTDKDLIVGNNAYIGQNQSSSNLDEKYLYFSDKSYLRRVKLNNSENFSLNGDFVGVRANAFNVNLPYSENLRTTEIFRVNEGNYQICDGQYLSVITGGNRYISLTNFDWNYNAVAYININEASIDMSHTPSISSDKRLKQEIKDIDVSWIDNLKVKEFEYKNTPDKKQIGLIAQDYIDEDYSKYFLNENVNQKDNKNYYSIAYGNITNALIKYCQELKKEVANLKQEIEVLKNEK